MDAVSNIITRFTRYIELVKKYPSTFQNKAIYKQLNDAIMESISNVDKLHQVRDLIKQIQEGLHSEDIILLNLYLMILLYSLAIQHQSKEHLYFAGLACSNVIGMYHYMYQHEITSNEIRNRCNEMMLVLLKSLTNAEVINITKMIIVKQLNTHISNTDNEQSFTNNTKRTKALDKILEQTNNAIDKPKNSSNETDVKNPSVGCLVSFIAFFILSGVLIFNWIIVLYQQKIAKQNTIQKLNSEKVNLVVESDNLTNRINILSNQANTLNINLNNLTEKLKNQQADVAYYESIPTKLENLQIEYNNTIKILEWLDKSESYYRSFAQFISYCYVTTDTSMCSGNISNPKYKWSEPLTDDEEKFLNNICGDSKYQSYAGMAHCDSYKARVNIDFLSKEISQMRKTAKIDQKHLLIAQQKYNSIKEQYESTEYQHKDVLSAKKVLVDDRNGILHKIDEIDDKINLIPSQ